MAALILVQSLTKNPGISNGHNDRFGGLAVRPIIDAQIKAGVFRFNPRQYQRPAASGAGRPSLIDNLYFGESVIALYHQRRRPLKSESIYGCSRKRPPTEAALSLFVEFSDHPGKAIDKMLHPSIFTLAVPAPRRDEPKLVRR
jgi:hypothetical protein